MHPIIPLISNGLREKKVFDKPCNATSITTIATTTTASSYYEIVYREIHNPITINANVSYTHN